MLDQVTNPAVVDVLSRGLQAANLRHQAISNNIANVNTPNFKKSDVVFEALLAKQLDLEPGKKKLSMVRTQDKHMPISLGDSEYPSPQLEEISTTSMRTDNNNVDIDTEMANLAKNNVYYNALTRQVGSYLSDMKSVIKG